MSRREFDNGLLLQFFEAVDAVFQTDNYFSLRFQGEFSGSRRSTQYETLIKFYIVKFLLKHCDFSAQQVAEFLLTKRNSVNFIDKQSKLNYETESGAYMIGTYRESDKYQQIVNLSKEITGDTKFYPPKPATK
jgi:hypothetical protein